MSKHERLDAEIFAIASSELEKEIEIEVLEDEEIDLAEYIKEQKNDDKPTE